VRDRRPPRGVALILTLWLIVVLGAVAASVTASTRSASTLTLNLRSRATARYAAESGVVAAIARLYQVLARARTPEERVLALSSLDQHFAALRDADIGAGRFSVTVIDASARIDLNRAPEETVRGLLAQLAGDRDAESLTAALQDWKDADGLRRPQGAEAGDYRGAGSPFVPANGPLRRLDELSRIAGFTDSLARALAPYVTVDGDLKINVNTAPEAVLAAIRGVGPAGARTLMARRKMGGFFVTAAALSEAVRGGPFGPGASLQLDVLPARLLVVSRGWEPGRPLTHEIQAVYELRGSNLVLRSWRERDL
jgi:general secretion pathway protein K